MNKRIERLINVLKNYGCETDKFIDGIQPSIRRLKVII